MASSRPARHVDSTTLLMEGIALTGAWVDREKGLLALIGLELGVSSRLLAYLRKGEPVVVDARPSDAIALALRAKAPILVDSAVIDAAKASDIVPERDDSARLSKWLESLDMEEFGKYRM